MPNWCSNSLEITAPTKEILEKAKALVFTDKRFNVTNGAIVDKIDFNILVPEPKDLPESPQSPDYATPAWYDWRVNNWGTKWNASEVTDPIEYGTTVSVRFETAWGPASPWVKSLAEAVPDLEVTHSYYEFGVDFSGKRKYVNGEVVLEEDHDEVTLDIWLEFGNDEDSFIDYALEYSLDKIHDYVDNDKLTPALAGSILDRYEDEESDFCALKEEADSEELEILLAKIRTVATKYDKSLPLTIQKSLD